MLPLWVMRPGGNVGFGRPMEAVMRTTAGAGRPHTRRPHTRRPSKTPARGVSTFPGDGLTRYVETPLAGVLRVCVLRAPLAGVLRVCVLRAPLAGVIDGLPPAFCLRPSPRNVETPLAGVFDGLIQEEG